MVIADTSDLTDSINNASQEIETFFSTVLASDIVIVTGDHISFEEKMLFNLAKSRVDELQGTHIFTEKYFLHTNVSGNSLALIGSEKTNGVSKALLEEGVLHDVQTTMYPPLIITKGIKADGSRVLILSSEKEMLNVGNSAIAKSPLNRFMDEKYVPFAATFMSILFLYLWSVFARTIVNLLSDFVSSKILGHKSAGKTIRKEKKEHIKAHELINGREVMAFIVYVLAFTFTMSWTWSSDLVHFKRMLFINLLVVGIISFLRETVRLFFCYRKKLRSEFVFWPFGTFIAVVSTLLGNTFSTIAYTLLDEDEKDEKRFGKGSFLIAFYTYIFIIIAYILNIFYPSLILQMAFVFSIMTLFIEFFPLRPMPGEEIKQWNFTIWLVSYILIIATYIFLNFTVYM